MTDHGKPSGRRPRYFVGFHSRASRYASAHAYDNLTWAACARP
jgi:hypothetical protein